MRLVVWLVLVLVMGFGAYVRLAPSDPARWHVPPQMPADLQPGEVRALRGAAALRLEGDGPTLLSQLDAAMLAWPRTIRLAGTVDDGRITWVSRSWFWGFPDHTTAQLRDNGIDILARLRFGGADLGVNAARLEAMKGALGQQSGAARGRP